MFFPLIGLPTCSKKRPCLYISATKAILFSILSPGLCMKKEHRLAIEKKNKLNAALLYSKSPLF